MMVLLKKALHKGHVEDSHNFVFNTLRFGVVFLHRNSSKKTQDIISQVDESEIDSSS